MLKFILGKEIASYVKQHTALMIISIIFAAASSLFVLAPAILLGPFVDECMKESTEPATWKMPWIEKDPDSWLSWERTEKVLVDNVTPNELLIILMAVALASVFGKSITTYISHYSAAAFSNRATRSLRVDLFRKFVSLPLSYYDRKKIGELISRASNDVSAMQSRIAYILIGLIEHPLTAVVVLIYLLIMNYKLTLLVFISVPVIVGVMQLFGKKVKKYARVQQDATALVTSSYHETIQCLKVVQSYVGSDYEEKRFRQLADYLYKKTMKWRRWDLGLSPVMDITVFLAAPGLIIAARLYFNHSLGEIIAMFYAFAKLYTPIKKLAKLNNELKTIHGMTKHLFGIMSTNPDIQNSSKAKDLPHHKESIEFENVSFGYSPDTMVLDNISFKINAGEMVAFVGSTGAGKSTLLDLIPRFYDVSSGNIMIDGIDIRNGTLDSLREQIGIVNQDIVLFHDTIAMNIGYGKANATPEEIESAAKVAHAHGFILNQPKGYETVIGDQGTLLSGGQRQRIAIARAVLVNPTILMLDEAASALDSESEKMVQKAIENLKGKKTILVVAHRLSTIMKSNCIYVLENGNIVESGTVDKLLALNGRFKKLHDLQFKNGS